MKRASITMCCALAVLSAAGVNQQNLFRLGGILPGHDPAQVEDYAEYVSEGGTATQASPFTFTATQPANSGLRVQDWLVAGDRNDIKLGKSVVRHFDTCSETMTWTLNRAFEGDGTLYVAARFYYITNSVSFHGNADGVSGSTASTGLQCFTNSYALTANGFTRTGYAFSNWTNDVGRSFADAETVQGADLSVSNNFQTADLYAVWSPNGYAVSYDLAGGTHGSAHPSSATYDTAFEVSDPARKGYSFAGWKVTSGLDTGTAKYGQDESSVSSSISSSTICLGSGGSAWFLNLSPVDGAAVTLTATWTAKSTGVHFNNYNATSGPSDVAVAYDSAYQSVQIPVWSDGSRFFRGYYTEPGGGGECYWDVDGQPAKSAWDVDAESITLYAFYEDSVYYVTYEPNGGGGQPFSASFTNGVEVTLADASAFTRQGSELIGWASRGDAASPEYAAGAKVTFRNKTADFPLYAIWRNYYYVSFDGNGATNETPMAVQSFAFGESKALNASEYGRVGYGFAGWAADAAAAAALDIAHADCEVVRDLETTVGATNRLFAAWRPISYVTAFDCSAHSSTKVQPVDCTYDVAFALPTLGYAAGDLWALVGWSNTVANVVYYTNEVSVVSNLCTTAGATNTLVAVWRSMVSDLSEAMDIDNLTWANANSGFDESWRVLDGIGYGTGSCAAQTGKPTEKDHMWRYWRMETSVTNSGTLAFWWKTSGTAKLYYYDWQQGRANQTLVFPASTEWTNVSVRVERQTGPALGGEVTIRLGPDQGNESDADTIYIDRMTWTPDGSSVEPADERQSIAGATVTLGGALVYTGEVLTQAVESVTLDGVEATFNVLGNTATDAGTYTLTVTGTLDFAGSVAREFTISPKAIDSSMVGGVESVVFTGSEFTPSPVVTDQSRGVELVNGTDYELSYADNVYAGTASVMVSGKGNYSGVVTSEFSIVRATYDMSAAKWDYAGAFEYDGTEKAVHVTGLPDGVGVSAYEGNSAVQVGSYTAHATLSYDSANFNEPVVGDLPWAIMSTEESSLTRAFAGLGTVASDGAGGWRVTLTNDVDGTVELPDCIGAVTIDLNGHGMTGSAGSDGADGLPALRIVPGDGDGAATTVTFVNSDAGAVASVSGGAGGDGNPPGDGGAGVEVAADARDGVVVNIGESVSVSGGAGGTGDDGESGADGKAVVGEIGENHGELAKIQVPVPEIAPKIYTGEPQTADVPESACWTVTANEGGTDVGTYEVTLELSDAQNTCWADGDGTTRVVEWRILLTEHECAVGMYFKATLVELGFDVPTNGTPYSVVAKGLPAGLKLKYNAAVKNKKGKVVTKAKSTWWIEGVPTAALDYFQNPPYLVITVDGVAGVHALPIEVLAQEVVDLGELALGQSINTNGWLSGVGAGWTVSGLPTGLKYAAKKVTKTTGSGKKKVTTTVAEAYAVYGRATKAGLFTVTAKKKKGSFYETLKYRVLVRPAPVDATVFGDTLTNIVTMAYVPVEWDLTGGDGHAGRVTLPGGEDDGDGHAGRVTLPVVSNVVKVAGLPSGVTFAAKDTYAYKNAKKRTGRYLKQYGQTIVGKPTKPGTYVVTFTKNVTTGTGKNRKTVAKTAQILWTVVANDAELSLGFNTSGGVIEGGTVGLAYTNLMAFTATSNATVTASGLPAGIKLVKLEEGGGPGVPALPATYAFAGFTAKAGTYLVTVKATLNGKSVAQRVALVVEALPSWAKGTFNGVVSRTGCQPVQDGGTGQDENAQAARSTSGLATITVSSVGKISGKFYDGGTNWTFSAASYTAAEAGTWDACPYHAFICSNVVAKYAYKVKEKVKGKWKTVTKYVERAFQLTVSPDPDASGVPVRGLATMEEGGGHAGLPDTTIEAWQNLWGSTYKAVGKRVFTTKSGSKTLAYRTFAFKGGTEAGEAIGLTEAMSLALKVTTAGAVTATMTFDTGKTRKDSKTKKTVKVYYKPTCKSVVIPASAAAAAVFVGDVDLYFAPSPANNFPGYAACVRLPEL